MSDPSPALPPLPATLAANPLLSAWLDFTCPGVVTIGTGKVEYGQGLWTALAQVAAEELDVDLRHVRVAPVSTATSPDEGVTSGSRSIEESGSALRQACAQARHLFLTAAADRLGAGAGALRVTDGEITTDAGSTGLTYWSLAGQAGPAAPGLLDREAGDPEPAKAPARWSVAGRSAARLDIPDKVTGRPRFLHDLVLPGMLYGRVIRPPAPAASLAGPGDPPLPGDVVTVRDGSFLGVVAPSDRAAVASARAVAGAARWVVTPSLPDERDLRGFLLSAPTQVVTVDELHDEEAAAAVTRTLEAEFTRPYLAHASMAPSCAVARWDGRRVTVWSHSQGVFALRGAIAAGLGLEAGQVTVNHVEGAGAYGHNGADDAALDAVLLARAVPGHPVRVLWSREDEMGWAPVGSAMLARLSAGLDAGGRIRTWRQDVWSNGFIGRPGSGGEPRLLALAHLAGGRPGREDGTGLGLGYARYKGTSGYCAAVARVEADTDVRVSHLWLAVDVGRVINPDGVINQVEGGAVQSASWTLRERVSFDRTRVTSVNWDTYPILRFTEVPQVAAVIVAAPGERETGAGEVAQGPVAGAIGNAVADAVGVRVRDLPLTREQITRAIEES